MMTSPAAKMRRRFPVSQGQDVVEETRQNAIYIIGRPSTARGTPGIASPIPPPFLTIERPLCG
jgi:hypothetical protein